VRDPRIDESSIGVSAEAARNALGARWANSTSGSRPRSGAADTSCWRLAPGVDRELAERAMRAVRAVDGVEPVTKTIEVV
jgi:hypothetical protein